MYKHIGRAVKNSQYQEMQLIMNSFHRPPGELHYENWLRGFKKRSMLNSAEHDFFMPPKVLRVAY